MEFLWGCGMGQSMARLIAHHLENLAFFTKAKSFPGTPFGTGRGFIQGYPTYPIMFNIFVGEVLGAT